MASLYNTIGQKTDTNLLADPQRAEKITVPMQPGEGELAAGTLIYRNADGFWAPAAAAQIANTNQLAVLKEAIDTGSTATGIAEDGIAYRAGRFINGRVILKSGTALTAANKVVLRGQDIVFDMATTDAEFNNEVEANADPDPNADPTNNG